MINFSLSTKSKSLYMQNPTNQSRKYRSSNKWKTIPLPHSTTCIVCGRPGTILLPFIVYSNRTLLIWPISAKMWLLFHFYTCRHRRRLRAWDIIWILPERSTIKCHKANFICALFALGMFLCKFFCLVVCKKICWHIQWMSLELTMRGKIWKYQKSYHTISCHILHY